MFNVRCRKSDSVVTDERRWLRQQLQEAVFVTGDKFTVDIIDISGKFTAGVTVIASVIDTGGKFAAPVVNFSAGVNYIAGAP